MKSSVTVIPFGGLGNRLRVMASAAASLTKGCSCTVLWFNKPELQADFEDLFEVSKPYDIKRGSLLQRMLQPWVKHIYTVRYPKLFKKLLGLYFDTVLLDEDIRAFTSSEVQKLLSQGGRCLIATCYEWKEISSYMDFKPTKSILDLTKAFKQSELFDHNTVGVHVRRTDHVDILKEYRFEDYFESMDAIIEKNRFTRFFICSDEWETKKKMKERYQNIVFFREAELSRDSLHGMQDALVDICLLSSCSLLLGSSKSSFVVLAAKFDKPLQLIDVKENHA